MTDSGNVTTKDALKVVATEEAKQGTSGAAVNALRTDLFDTSDIQAQLPDKNLYFVNTTDEGNVLYHTVQRGRVKLTGKLARRVGNLELFEKPGELHRRHLADEKEMNQRRMAKARADHEILAEKIARELRDKHGLIVPAERLIRDDIRG